jgi:hypothetical protein
MASMPFRAPLTSIISSSAIICRPPFRFKLNQFIVEPNITVSSGQISLSLVDLVLNGFILFLLLFCNGNCVLLEPINSISNHRLRHGLFRDDGLLPGGTTGCLFNAESPISLGTSVLGSLNIWRTMQVRGREWGVVIGFCVNRHICRRSCRDAVALRHGPGLRLMMKLGWDITRHNPDGMNVSHIVIGLDSVICKFQHGIEITKNGKTGL